MIPRDFVRSARHQERIERSDLESVGFARRVLGIRLDYAKITRPSLSGLQLLFEGFLADDLL